MGAAASFPVGIDTASSTSAIVDGESITSNGAVSVPFPKNGVKLSFYDDFTAACGGREAFRGLTTTDVCDSFIKPMTASAQLSYCDLLQLESHPAVQTASVFISHAWKYSFLDVVDALQYHFRNEPEICIWFDLFSNNQHKAVDLDFNWWCNTFKSAISDFGHVVMVLSPWNDPIPLTRAWCLFELYCCADSKGRFEVAMSDDQQMRFLEDMKTKGVDAIDDMLGTIDCIKSESFNPTDKERIFDVVSKSVGFSGINAMVFKELRSWVIDTVEVHIQRTLNEQHTPDNDAIVVDLNVILAMLYKAEGRYGLSQNLLIPAVDARCKDFGENHKKTIEVMCQLASCYSQQYRWAEATELYCNCLERQAIDQTLEDKGFQQLRLSMASLYEDQGLFNEALHIIEQCFESWSSQHGEDDPFTLEILAQLAGAFYSLGNFDKHQELTTKCYSKRVVVLGQNHPDTLHSMDQMAEVFDTRQQFQEAEELYKKSFELRTEKFGRDHPSSLASLNNLASFYESQDDLEKAENKFYECWKLTERLLGSGHPDSVLAMNNLAIVYDRQGRRSEADEIYKTSLQLYQNKLGLEHRTTLIAQLTYLQFQADDSDLLDDAVASMLAGWETFRSVFGHDHPESLEYQSIMADVLLKLEEPEAEKAVQFAESAYQGQLVKLGLSHDDVASSLSTLAEAYVACDQFADASTVYEDFLRQRQESLGIDHQITLRTVCDLAQFYDELDEDDPHLKSYREKAVGLFQTCYSISKDRYGDHSQCTLSALYSLAVHYSSNELFDKANEMFEVCLSRQIALLGESHKDVLATMYAFGENFKHQEKYSEAVSILERCLKLRHEKYKTSSGSRAGLVPVDEDTVACEELLAEVRAELKPSMAKKGKANSFKSGLKKRVTKEKSNRQLMLKTSAQDNNKGNDNKKKRLPSKK